jgi:predicted KAP-like P-loop ATPase
MIYWKIKNRTYTKKIIDFIQENIAMIRHLIQTFEDSKKLALEKNNESCYLEQIAEQKSQKEGYNFIS